MFTSELLGLAVAASVMPDDPSHAVRFGLITAGFLGGALVADRTLVRPFDYTESDARLLGYGTLAGAAMGVIVPVLAQSGSERLFLVTATGGAILGAMITHNFITPERARGLDEGGRRTGSTRRIGGVELSVSPHAALMARAGLKGNHSLLSLTF